MGGVRLSNILPASLIYIANIWTAIVLLVTIQHPPDLILRILNLGRTKQCIIGHVVVGGLRHHRQMALATFEPLILQIHARFKMMRERNLLIALLSIIKS